MDSAAEANIDKSDKPEICTRCRFGDFNCVICERLDRNAEQCSFFTGRMLIMRSRYTVSWPVGQGQRRWIIHYPNGSMVTGTITTEED